MSESAGAGALKTMSVISGSIRLEAGTHVAHFYRDDAELSKLVVAHLEGGLRDGEVVVVIATEEHTRAFERELAAAGVDIRDGSMITLDAPSALAMLSDNGRISADAFRRVIGGAIRSAAEGGRAVRAYGEIVDILWRGGNVGAAIEVETLWNELIGELRFSLLCAYRSTSSEGPEHEQALDQVCRLHTAVTSANEVSRRFRPDACTPSAARRLLDDAVERWGPGEAVIGDARLLLSELVTNAVVHAGSPLSVTIRREDSKLRLAVTDESPELPTPRATEPQAAMGGRGLRIVAALSRSWGITTTSGGKVVWAEL